MTPLEKAKNAYLESTNYMDTNYRKQLDNNLRMFQNKHPSGSKYNKPSYKYRSKLFRPKTRSAVRKSEAAGTAAFFSNSDAVEIDPQNENDEVQQASADFYKALLNYRLDGKPINWFLTCIGGLQDANVTGVVCSYNSWKYSEKRTTRKETYPVIDEFTGEQAYDPETGQLQFSEQEIENVEVIQDEPSIELYPIENIRFHPAANWIDPINTSPYLIRLIPMYVYEVRERMNTTDPKTGQPAWKQLTDDQIKTARQNTSDSTRKTRQGNRQDPVEESSALSDFDVVWVHENIMIGANGDEVYYTLFTEQLLSDPVPLEDVYFTGERPVTMGFVVLETHRVMPSAPVELGESLQKEANEIANERRDNVKFVMNKRYIVKRGSNVDTRSIVRNVPASVTFANDVNDVKAVDFNDVTGSSYAEEDRINVDFDELIGNFSQGSVQTNRKLNETVGGMNLMYSSANQMTEYGLKLFVETWMEPTLKQLVKLEQNYETDEVVMSLAQEKAQIAQKYGISEDLDSLLNQELTLKVNVGLGASNPMFRLEKLIYAMRTFIEIATTAPPQMKLDEMAKEIFGAVGYKDGSRFMDFAEEEGEDPQIQEMQAALEEMQQIIESKQIEAEKEKEAKLEAERLSAENAQVIALHKNQTAKEIKAAELEAADEAKAADLIAQERQAERDRDTKVDVAQIMANAQVAIARMKEMSKDSTK